MILQDMIESKEMLDKVKKGLIRAAQNKDWNAMFSEIINTNDLKVFNENVNREKGRLMAAVV